jgi:IS30 family transposase
MMKAKIAERRRQVVTLTQQGWSLGDIAERLGVTDRTVARDRLACGIAHPKAPPMSTDELAQAQQLLDDGASYLEVARSLGRNHQTIAQRFPGQGWTAEQTGQYLQLLALRKKLGI